MASPIWREWLRNVLVPLVQPRLHVALEHGNLELAAVEDVPLVVVACVWLEEVEGSVLGGVRGADAPHAARDEVDLDPHARSGRDGADRAVEGLFHQQLVVQGAVWRRAADGGDERGELGGEGDAARGG